MVAREAVVQLQRPFVMAILLLPSADAFPGPVLSPIRFAIQQMVYARFDIGLICIQYMVS